MRGEFYGYKVWLDGYRQRLMIFGEEIQGATKNDARGIMREIAEAVVEKQKRVVRKGVYRNEIESE